MAYRDILNSAQLIDFIKDIGILPLLSMCIEANRIEAMITDRQP